MQGLSNDQVLRYVIDGGVMEEPDNCPEKLYELMRRCWQHKHTLRPSFMDIVTLLLTDVNTSFAAVSFYHSEEAQEVGLSLHSTRDPIGVIVRFSQLFLLSPYVQYLSKVIFGFTANLTFSIIF